MVFTGARENIGVVCDEASRYWDNFKLQARGIFTDEPPEEVEIIDMPEDVGFISGLQEMSTLSYKQRLMGFFAALFMGLCFFVIAFFFLSTIVLFPKKFAFYLTAGNFFCLASTTFLVGLRQQLRSLFDAKRLEAVVVYAVSIVLTLVAALHWRSGVFSALFAVIQIFCLFWYSLSYVPFAHSVVGVLCSHLSYFVSFVSQLVKKSLRICCG